ncbi:hypothetical protein JAAARDRAFT_126019 [Jaapia argillacea MUCL 33604]|uniref:Anaphase-promoting complex subunit 4 WD40 domain-containing protein n=1 Tax=Jaapia argillacea MUCL 33604 TaxID=933084 RepID=A0A067PZ95_9AGAM|nr:hypothetical protein JAAARDRAFT_126019 [Jaapia argillacea MUCL 33604]
MIQTGLVQNAHDDLVTDASYDFYGLRLATCGLDQRIKIWGLDESTGTWNVEDDWKAHDAPISKLSWAHPEFGSILASSSFDRTVKIWEQTSGGEGDSLSPHSHSLNGTGPGGDLDRGKGRDKWVERAVLVDSKGTVRMLEFSPRAFGLKVASISSDNHLRIYECLEQPTLTSWVLTEEVDILTLPYSSTPSSNSHSHTVAIATPTQTHSTLDRDGPGAASASLVAHALQQSQAQAQGSGGTVGRPGMGNREADGGWCLSWCKERYWGEVLAVGCGVSGVIKIIQTSPSRRPVTLLTLDPSPTLPTFSGSGDASGPTADSDIPTPFAITCVSWAPSCGRSYHLIATGGRDGRVRIWKIKPEEIPDGEGDSEEREREGWTGVVVADFDEHKSAVGRVEWNITGTILSSAGNDGRVRLWKATAGSVWRPAGHLSVEQAEEHERADVDMEENQAAD